MTDVIAGTITMAFVDVAGALSNVTGGKARALVITSAKRSALLPDIPTMQEAGFKDFDLTYWTGLFGPAGLAERRGGDARSRQLEIMGEKAMQGYGARVGLDPSYLPAADHAGLCEDRAGPLGCVRAGGRHRAELRLTWSAGTKFICYSCKNSLLLVGNSLFSLQQFPVPAGAGIQAKSPEIIELAGPLMRQAAPKTQNCLFFSLLAGNCDVETGSIPTASAASI